MCVCVCVCLPSWITQITSHIYPCSRPCSSKNSDLRWACKRNFTNYFYLIHLFLIQLLLN